MMEFNKVLTRKGSCRDASVIFRKLVNIGDNDRWQGSINTAGAGLIKNESGDITGLSVVYSDEHGIIGFRPVKGKSVKWVFGATELFENLPLVVGKHYTLKITDGIAVIDSAEFNTK